MTLNFVQLYSYHPLSIIRKKAPKSKAAFWGWSTIEIVFMHDYPSLHKNLPSASAMVSECHCFFISCTCQQNLAYSEWSGSSNDSGPYEFKLAFINIYHLQQASELLLTGRITWDPLSVQACFGTCHQMGANTCNLSGAYHCVSGSHWSIRAQRLMKYQMPLLCISMNPSWKSRVLSTHFFPRLVDLYQN